VKPFAPAAPRITISGGDRVLIEGHRGLLEFGEERIAAAGITRRFENKDLNRCMQEIKEYLLGFRPGR